MRELPDAYVTPGSDPVGGAEVEAPTDVEVAVIVLKVDDAARVLVIAVEVDGLAIDDVASDEVLRGTEATESVVLLTLLDTPAEDAGLVAVGAGTDEDEAIVSSFNRMAPSILSVERAGLETEDFK